MTMTKKAVALLSGGAAVVLPLTGVLPAEAASTPSTLTISTTKAKLEGGIAYRIDENGGKKLIEGAHFKLSGFVTCNVDRLSTQGFVMIYTGDYPQPGGLSGGWVACNTGFTFNVPVAGKGKTMVTANLATRYGGGTVIQEVKVIAPAAGPTS